MSEQTRNFAIRADNLREIRCLVKGGVIAAGACVTQQETGCFCPAGFGALEGHSSAMAVVAQSAGHINETHPGKAAEIARVTSARTALAQLKARASGFSRQPEPKQYAGPALRVRNEKIEAARRAQARLDGPARAFDEAEPIEPAVGEEAQEQPDVDPLEARRNEIAAAVERQRAATIDVPVTRRTPAEAEARAKEVATELRAPPRLCSVTGCGVPLAAVNKSGKCQWCSQGFPLCSTRRREYVREVSRPVVAAAPPAGDPQAIAPADAARLGGKLKLSPQGADAIDMARTTLEDLRTHALQRVAEYQAEADTLSRAIESLSKRASA